MMRSMYSGVSGLKTHQTKMDVIGNNIANVNTVGFKSSSVTFSEIMYQNLSGASGQSTDRYRWCERKTDRSWCYYRFYIC